MGYVLCTCDTDYLKMASTGIEHNGIVFAAQEKYSVGEWVAALELLCNVYTPEDMRNHIEYI
jgi:hypothetical protein